MKAIEFQSQLGSDGTLTVPATVADNLTVGQPIRVLVLIAENDEDKAWEQLAAIDFGEGYSDGDAIYDQLSDR
jgi:hypothetical protein